MPSLLAAPQPAFTLQPRPLAPTPAAKAKNPNVLQCKFFQQIDSSRPRALWVCDANGSADDGVKSLHSPLTAEARASAALGLNVSCLCSFIYCVDSGSSHARCSRATVPKCSVSAGTACPPQACALASRVVVCSNVCVATCV